MAPLSERALARTHGHRSYSDTWDVVVDYRRFQRYVQRHPEEGYRRISQSLNLSEGRIRRWIDDDATPTAVTFVEWARERGYTTAEFGSRTFEALNTLLAWVLSNGNVNQHWTAEFDFGNDAQREVVTDALETLGLSSERFSYDGQGNTDAPKLRLTHDARAFGRVLDVLGAPVGTDAEANTRLPDYLRRAPAGTRERFCEVFVRNRSGEVDGQLVVRTQARREHFRQEFRRLLDEVTDAEIETQENFLLLDGPEEWLGWE
jgi:hypothetical protein